MSSSHYMYAQKWPYNQNKPQQFVLHLSPLSDQANVLKDVFAKQGGLFKHFLTSFICFRPSLVVKGLPMCNFNCEPCFCQIFWQFGTEFLCLAKLSFQGGTPYNDLYGEAPLETGTFFRLQVYQRVGILLIELYQRVEKSAIWVRDRARAST